MPTDNAGQKPVLPTPARSTRRVAEQGASSPLEQGRERFNARLSTRQKQILERAAAIQGRTLTGFVLVHAQEAAEKVIQDNAVLHLSERDAQAFFAALTAPAPPSDALHVDIARMREIFGDE